MPLFPPFAVRSRLASAALTLPLLLCSLPAGAQEAAETSTGEAAFLAVDGATQTRLRDELRQEPPAGADQPALINFYRTQYDKARKLGDAELMLRLLDLRLAAAKGIPKEEAYALWSKFWRLTNLGRRAEGIAIGESLLTHPGLARDPVSLVRVHCDLARQYLYQYNLRRAGELLDAAAGIVPRLSTAGKAGWWKRYAEMYVYYSKRRLSVDLGKLDQAEIEARAAIVAASWLRENFALSGSDKGNVRQEIDNWYVTTRIGLADTLAWNGKYYEARQVLADARRLQKQDLMVGADAAHLLYQSGTTELGLGEYGNALGYLRASEALYRQQGVPELAANFSWVLNGQIQANLGLGRLDEAKAILERRIALTQDKANSIPVPGTISGAVFLSGGDYERAEGYLRNTYNYQNRAKGSAHPDTLIARGLLAVARLNQGKGSAEFSAFTEFTVLQEVSRKLIALHDNRTDAEESAIQRVYKRLILDELLKRTSADSKAELATLAFQVADFLRSSVVQDSVVASAARSATSIPGLADRVREEQDTRNELRSLSRFISEQLSKPEEKQVPEVVARMRARSDDLGKQLEFLRKDILSRFPDYASLISPSAPDFAEVASALGPDEALISILPTRERTYVWAVAPDGRRLFHVAPLTQAQISESVRKLRATLDIEMSPNGELQPFDAQSSYLLYQQLLEPVKALWGDSKGIVVAADGALAQIPFAVLLTRAPANKESKEPAWLVNALAITHVPSLSAWVSLRRAATVKENRQPFAGFGDPVFSVGKTGEPPSESAPASTRRSLRLARKPISTGVGDTNQAEPALAALDRYALLQALPDTRHEILGMARAIGADTGRDVFLGRRASRQAVMNTPLHDRRVIAFATHGLVPGDLPGLGQPALAMSSNENPADSPLLTLDDVLSLKLNADWVVLSACNTAAADGQASQAISGLGRGFFYAGARALLVTHWAVESASASRLVTEVFKQYGAENGLSRAKALRAGQLTLMKLPQYQHPFFWAPYALIGDGGR